AWSPVVQPELTVDLADDGTLTFTTADGRPLRSDRPPLRHGPGWRHQAPLRTGEQIHGLGERALPFDLRGHTCAMWNSEPGGHYAIGEDPVYCCVPVYVAIHDEGSYLAFYENPHRARFSFGDEVDARFDGGALRYYVAAGPVPRPRRAGGRARCRRRSSRHDRRPRRRQGPPLSRLRRGTGRAPVLHPPERACAARGGVAGLGRPSRLHRSRRAGLVGAAVRSPA